MHAFPVSLAQYKGVASGLEALPSGNLSRRGLRILDSFFLSQKQRDGRDRLAEADRQGLCSSHGWLGGGQRKNIGVGVECPQAHPQLLGEDETWRRSKRSGEQPGKG